MFINRADILRLTENEVVLFQLTSADLLLESVAAQIHIAVQSLGLEDLLNLLGVIVGSGHNRHNQDLSGAEPEWPLSTKVLSQNAKHSLETTQHGSVNHDRACVSSREFFLGVAAVADSRLSLVGNVSELESSRQVEVELHGTALVLTLQRIKQGDINLGTVESTITRVELPLSAGLLGEGLEGFLKFLLGSIPCSDITNVLLRSGRKLELESEAENSVDAAQEVESRLDFLSNLQPCSAKPPG